MKTFDYIATIYRTALFTHPVLFVLMRFAAEKVFDFFELFFSGLFGVMFSLPAFVLCLLALRYIILRIPNCVVKIITWILLAVCKVVISFGFLANWFFGFDCFSKLICFCVPGCTAAVLSILYHRSAFLLSFIH